MKVSELEGALLDYWVAKAEGIDVVDVNKHVRHLGNPFLPVLSDGGGRDGPHYYRPSTDWAQGGPIIERERIDVISNARDPATGWSAWSRDVIEVETGHPVEWPGSTALIAAMRAYVTSKFGDTVTDEAPPCSA